jgi:hypothetical protein
LHSNVDSQASLRHDEGYDSANDYGKVENVPAFLEVGALHGHDFDERFDGEDDHKNNIEVSLDQVYVLGNVVPHQTHHNGVQDNANHDKAIKLGVISNFDAPVTEAGDVFLLLPDVY